MADIGSQAVEEIVAIRERWHTKNHPFYVGFSEGSVALKALGELMVQHYQHTRRATSSFGIAYYRAPPEARAVFLDNLAEEEGRAAGPGEGRHAVHHLDIIIDFCERAGIRREAVMKAEQLPSWRARTYNYINTVREEPIPVVLAFQSTQEGQQPAINAERVLPALIKRHGFKMGTPEITFFVEHEIADADHSNRQIEVVRRLINTPELKRRAIEVAQTAVRIRWDCMTEVWRRAVLGERDPLPAGIAA